MRRAPATWRVLLASPASGTGAAVGGAPATATGMGREAATPERVSADGGPLPTPLGPPSRRNDVGDVPPPTASGLGTPAGAGMPTLGGGTMDARRVAESLASFCMVLMRSSKMSVTERDDCGRGA